MTPDAEPPGAPPGRALHWRLLVLLAALLLPLAAALLLVAVRSATRYHQEIVQRQNLDLAAMLVADSGLMADGALDVDKLADLVKTMAMTNPGVEIFVLDAAGDLVTELIDAPLERAAVPLERLERFARARADPVGADLPLLGPDPLRGGSGAFSAAPLPGGVGWLYVLLTDAEQVSLVRRVRASTSLQLAWFAGGGVAAALLLIAGFAAALLTRRLRRLQGELRAFEVDGSGPPIAPPAHVRDDLDELRRDVAGLAGRARAQLAELRRADRERRELVGNLSHDLRTPLAALRGYLEAARDERRAADARASYLAGAERSAERLERLVVQLFELSRLDAGAAALRPEPFPPAELASDVVQKFALRAEERGVRLRFEPRGPLPFVTADLQLVERALSNLLDNALRHVPDGGRVELHLEAAPGGERVRFEVADDGSGIDEAALPRVFERFVRAEASRSGEGSGVGLAIVRRVAEIHGGTVWARNGAPERGGGARVGFSLALAGAADTAHPGAGEGGGAAPTAREGVDGVVIDS